MLDIIKLYQKNIRETQKLGGRTILIIVFVYFYIIKKPL